MAHIDDVIDVMNRASRAEAERDEARSENAALKAQMEELSANYEDLKDKYAKRRDEARAEAQKLREERDAALRVVHMAGDPVQPGFELERLERIRLRALDLVVERREEKGGE